jgi:hypothetical protein
MILDSLRRRLSPCLSCQPRGSGKMRLAKNVIDLGLSTNKLEPMLQFWQREAGLRFDHVLPVRRGQKQYRHDALGSVIKLNHHAELLPAAAQSGYRELMIAREGLKTSRSMLDPDGNHVRLVPPGYEGITQLAVRMEVRSLNEHRKFYGDVLGRAALVRRFCLSPWRQSPSSRGKSRRDDRSGSPGNRLALHHPTGHRHRRCSGKSAKQGRARRPCTDNARRRGADIDDTRSGRQLDRAVASGLNRWQPFLREASQARLWSRLR